MSGGGRPVLCCGAAGTSSPPPARLPPTTPTAGREFTFFLFHFLIGELLFSSCIENQVSVCSLVSPLVFVLLAGKEL